MVDSGTYWLNARLHPRAIVMKMGAEETPPRRAEAGRRRGCRGAEAGRWSSRIRRWGAQSPSAGRPFRGRMPAQPAQQPVPIGSRSGIYKRPLPPAGADGPLARVSYTRSTRFY